MIDLATGHTHRVLDGEITNASEFAYECSKSFVWSWRDRNELAYPPNRSIHERQMLIESLVNLEGWDALNEEERYTLWSEYAKNQQEQYDNEEQRTEENRTKLKRILDEVYEIQVPETHKNFRDFMIEQLTSTIDFDGTFNENWFRVQPYVEWCEAHRANLVRAIEVYSEGLVRAEKNYGDSVAWISTLAQLYGLEVADASGE